MLNLLFINRILFLVAVLNLVIDVSSPLTVLILLMGIINKHLFTDFYFLSHSYKAIYFGAHYSGVGLNNMERFPRCS